MSRFTLTAQHAADIMTNAIEAGHYGIGYWCGEVDYDNEDLFAEIRDRMEEENDIWPVYSVAEYFERGGAMIIKDSESDDEWTVDLAKLRVALENENLPHASAARILQGEDADDAADADLIVQVAIFGEIIFG